MQDPNEFATLGLSEQLLRSLAEKNYNTPSPIQKQAIPHLLEGRDLWGCAQTGTGKTAAFALPILNNLAASGTRAGSKQPRVLVLTPTRELAVQISASFSTYGKNLSVSHAVVYGGVGIHQQMRALARGVDVLVATPGRLLDLLSQRALNLDRVGIFVLDEADRMLDMGFAPDVKRIAKLLPSKRQSMLFSATMPDEIRELAESLLRDPVRIEVTPSATTAERISQRICHVSATRKNELLVHLLRESPEGLALVFTRTKHGANRLATRLAEDGYRATALHGNKSQAARQKALEEFRSGKAKVLVATDIASRGIDVKGITLVVNFDVPVEPEVYVHRIGRTARAGAEGFALTLCSPAERHLLRGILKLIKQEIETHPHPFEEKQEEKEHRKPKTVPGYDGRARRRPASRWGNRRSQGGGGQGGQGGGGNQGAGGAQGGGGGQGRQRSRRP